MKSLTIAPIGLGDLLASNYFAVPMFQRSYAWKSVPHVRNMLTDLYGAMLRRRDESYFMGSIVVVDRPKSKALEVVDGQQRLATVSILLAAIRDYHWKIGNDGAAVDYDQRFLRALHVPTGKRIPKLKMNEVDDRCFAGAILERPNKRRDEHWRTASHKRLVEAYEYCVDWVEKIANVHAPKEAVANLYQLAEFIRTNVQIIRVTVGDDADAFTVFETLNDRHLPLTVADLLKNFLFGLVGEEWIDEAKGNWRQMIGSLQTIKGKRDRIVDFIRQLWGSMHGLVREKDLFRDIKQKITDEDGARQLSAALADQAADYAAVLNPASPIWEKFGATAIDAMVTFNALRVERIRPLLLAILNKFPDKDIEKSLAFLRSLAVRIVVTGGINGTIEEKIFELAVKVHKGQIKKTSALALAWRPHVPNDQIFSAHFATMPVTKANLARFYLRELDEAAKGDEDADREVRRDEKRVTLEHIIPLADSERLANWPPELHGEPGEVLAKRLGNQTLLGTGPNSRLNGKSYDQKRAVYAECEGIYITKQIARDYETWNEVQVNDRQQKLAKLALQRWPITAPKRK